MDDIESSFGEQWDFFDVSLTIIHDFSPLDKSGGKH